MTNLQGSTHQIKKILGNLYGLRTWIEYGFRQCKQELGWTDYRLTLFEQIEKWWEIIMSAYWMISCHSQLFCALNQSQALSSSNKGKEDAISDFSSHSQWSNQSGWKSTLNNLRLIIQPIIILWLISPWLDVFPNRYLCLGFHHLIDTINQFQPFYSSG
jgi:hypothetical protein